MLKNRKFRIVAIDSESTVGDKPMKAVKTVSYNGRKKAIRL